MRVVSRFFWYPDPRFPERIRPNDKDPTGSGSETLHILDIYSSDFHQVTKWNNEIQSH